MKKFIVFFLGVVLGSIFWSSCGKDLSLYFRNQKLTPTEEADRMMKCLGIGEQQ